jgi:AcrR family transcriptional regulator
MAGVVPNAAYRHFAGHAALLDAVRGAALGLMARAMEAEIDHATRHLSAPVARARAAFKAVGTGYVRFALAEPGLFRTAFVAQPFDVANGSRDDFRGDSGRDPFEILCGTLDDMVTAGALGAAQRPGAEFLAWSAVHGLAMLALDGPLRALPAAHIEAMAQRAVAMVEQGLAG